MVTNSNPERTIVVRSEPVFAPPPAWKAGFTLVEMMAVMAVIAILLSVAAVGIQSIEKGQATTTALAVTEALFDEARSVAMGNGTRARLLIHNHLDDQDLDDRERYLRYMCVAAQEKDADGNPTSNWQVVTRGTQLPAGVYYSPEETKAASQGIEVGEPGTMQIKLPGSNAAKTCIYYEFNAEGVCVDGGQSQNPSANDDPETGGVVVLVGGARPRDASEPILDKGNKVGFVIWRNGRTSLFRDPKQMN